MVVWAAKTETFQRFLGFNFVLPPSTSLPLDPPSTPSPSTASLSLPEGEGPAPFNEAFPFVGDDDPTSNTFSKWDKVSNDVSELLKVGVAVWRGGSDGWRVMCKANEVCWRAMVTTHWPKLLEHYGYSTSSR